MLSIIGTIVFCAIGVYIALDCLYLIFNELTAKRFSYMDVVDKLLFELPDEDSEYLYRTYGYVNVMEFCRDISLDEDFETAYNRWFTTKD